MKTVVLCVAAMILLSGCSLGFAWVGEIRLCGRQLADAVTLLCQNKHYEPQNEVGLSRRSLRQYRPAFGSVTGWLLSQSSSEVENYRNLQRRGIVDECCRNTCTMEELAQYCG